MITYDEKQLVAELANLDEAQNLAFATSCAARQVSSYLTFHSKDARSENLPSETVAELWRHVLGSPQSRVDWEQRQETLMDLMPSQEQHWSVGDALVEDAIASILYSVRYLETKSLENAAWAARRAYEAADQAAIRLLHVRLDEPRAEKLIASHIVVQRELERQKRDRDLLKTGNLAAVYNLARSEDALTEAERSDLLNAR